MSVHWTRVRLRWPKPITSAVRAFTAYRWLKQYDGGGFGALESHMPRGSEHVITQAIEDWMKQVVLDKTPVDFGFDMHLWACPVLSALLLDKFGVKVSDTAVRQHLQAMD